jgi:ribosomal protein S18 acetylase RimI-like enzyme
LSEPAVRPAVRPAREPDAEPVAELLYESAAGMYDRFAGGRRRALRLLARAFERPGNNASREIVTVVERDGAVVGALAAFPVDEAAARTAAFLKTSLRTIPPWRWPAALWLYWSGARAVPNPPEAALYVDALAILPPHRRRGLARSLLVYAEERAAELRLSAIALDTSLDNKPARALYVSSGYDEVAYRPSGRGLPGFVALVKQLS